MSFPRDSSFAQALDAERSKRNQITFQTPEKIRADQDARREADAKVIDIPTEVFEDWVRDLDQHEDGDVRYVVERMRSYLP